MEQCNKIAASAEEYLTSSGFKVKRAVKGQDMYVSIAESNEWNADLHICIHTNAGGGKGCELYTYIGTPTLNEYAKPIYDAISALTLSSDRGLKKADFAELRETSAEAVYCECEFHDDPSTAKWIVEHTEDLGRAIAEGVCNATGVTLKEPISCKLYRIQVGAFSVKENAEAYLSKLKAAGFDGFIIESDI